MCNAWLFIEFKSKNIKKLKLDALKKVKRLVLRGVFSLPPAVIVNLQKLCRLGLGKYKL